jgi:hypothetical protein
LWRGTEVYLSHYFRPVDPILTIRVEDWGINQPWDPGSEVNLALAVGDPCANNSHQGQACFRYYFSHVERIYEIQFAQAVCSNPK